MSGRLESIIRSKQGNTLIIGLVSIAILGVVVVAMSQAFFSMGRSRATVKAKTSFIDYENAFVELLGQQALLNLSSCSVAALNNMNLPLGDQGSARVLAGTLKTQLSTRLQTSQASADLMQTELNSVFNSCPDGIPTVPNSQPGVYLFCMGFEGLAGQSFQGLAGAFAKVRLELSSSSRAMQERVLAQALTCDQFRNPSRVGREIKISYLIYFKRANDPNGVFKKSGSRIYSQ